VSAPLRIVIDTNVLVSALLFEHSVPGRSVQLAFREHRILQSAATSSEIQAVLGRSKLSAALSAKVRTDFIEKLQLAAIRIPVVSTFAACRQPFHRTSQ
jgi:predicted nucleic acid-binding protein